MPHETADDGRRVGHGLLHDLLDRAERANTDRRIGKSTPVSLLSDVRRGLDGVLRAAEAIGAVTLETGRRTGLIEKVFLANLDKLYVHLVRPRPAELATGAEAKIRSGLTDLPADLERALKHIADGWAAKRNLIRDLTPADTDQAILIFRCVTALVAGTAQGADMRTFSGEVAADTKFVERNTGKIADLIKLAGYRPTEMSSTDVIASFGVNRWSMACMVAGPVSYRSIPLPCFPYIGLAPEMIDGLGLLREPAWILLIENWSSFNRQVREAREPDGLVIYTGGFPGDATLKAITELARASSCPVFHWGDIDVGGLRIAYRLEQSLARIDRRLELHLMTPEIAAANGVKVDPVKVFRDDPASSCVADLAAFLASSDAHFLEQEVLSPVAP
jgi:hypothetical protein